MPINRIICQCILRWKTVILFKNQNVCIRVLYSFRLYAFLPLQLYMPLILLYLSHTLYLSFSLPSFLSMFLNVKKTNALRSIEYDSDFEIIQMRAYKWNYLHKFPYKNHLNYVHMHIKKYLNGRIYRAPNRGCKPQEKNLTAFT